MHFSILFELGDDCVNGRGQVRSIIIRLATHVARVCKVRRRLDIGSSIIAVLFATCVTLFYLRGGSAHSPPLDMLFQFRDSGDRTHVGQTALL